MSKTTNRLRNGLVAALDVGSTKICCFIARVEGGDVPRVIGMSHQVSEGVQAGTVTDMDAVANSILTAVHAAEQMAGETIRSVLVNVSCGRPSSRTVRVEVSIAGHAVGDADIRKVLAQAVAHHEPGERELLHSIPVGFTIDDARNIRDPRGMFGERLGVDMHMVTAAAGALRNLTSCVARCRLDVDAAVASPYASGLSCLVDDERKLGATVIDMGGGTTTIAVFADDQIIFSDSVPAGGLHVTHDIARGLGTPIADAERMKTLFGSCIPSSFDDRELIDVPRIGEQDADTANHVPRSLLVGIIRPRLEEIFELVRDRLEASGHDRIAGRRVVLTGGASQLQGVTELASLIFDKQARLGRPVGIPGLAEATGGPAFSTAAGLLLYTLRESRRPLPARGAAPRARSTAPSSRPKAHANGSNGLFGRAGHWLRENF
ncbi:MAG: cell division protein FtsA [Alphaproteobacteria bacterium]